MLLSLRLWCSFVSDFVGKCWLMLINCLLKCMCIRYFLLMFDCLLISCFVIMLFCVSISRLVELMLRWLVGVSVCKCCGEKCIGE